VEHKINSFQHDPLQVTNKTISRQGLANLCYALCHEIQIYKKILKISINLSELDLQQSLKELHQICPKEESISSCEYNSFLM